MNIPKKWKQFDFTDIFEIKKGFYNKKPEDSGNGTIPFLGATDSNNGVTRFLTLSEIKHSTRTGESPNSPIDRKLFPGHAIAVTNNGSVGHAYYHATPFTCSHDINPLYLRDHEMSRDEACFLIKAIEKQGELFQYARKWRPIRMMKSKIMLPVTEDDLPDYDYMANYSSIKRTALMKKYVSYARERVEKLGEYQSIVALDRKEWKAFLISEIFDILPGKRLVAADTTPGKRPFIGALDNNNGVARFVDDTNVSLDKNVLGVNYNGNGMVIGFYHPYECIFSDDVKRFHLKHHEDNEFVLLFMKVAILQQKSKFGYLYKFNAERMANTRIMLPVTNSGLPDYDYMERHSKNLLIQKYNQYLQYLDSKENTDTAQQ